MGTLGCGRLEAITALLLAGGRTSAVVSDLVTPSTVTLPVLHADMRVSRADRQTLVAIHSKQNERGNKIEKGKKKIRGKMSRESVHAKIAV